MNGNVTHISFGDKRVVEAPQLHMFDYGQILVFDDITLPETYEVLFSNNVMDKAMTVIGTSEGVAIPDSLLETGKNILAWIFLHDTEDDGETEYVVRIPVRSRSRLDDELTEEDYHVISDLVAVIQTLTVTIRGLEERIVALEARIPALNGWKTLGGGQNDSP